MQGSTRSIDISYAERHGKESNQYDAYDINNTLHNTYIYIYKVMRVIHYMGCEMVAGHL